MKTQKIFLPFFVTLLLISCVTAANAITLDLPAESATMSTATQYLNASLDSNDHEIENISFYYRPVSGTGTWTLIGYAENTTNAQTTFNATWDATGVIDNNNSEINATASDVANAHVSTDSSVKVIIDNGDPTAAWSTASVASGIKLGKIATFTAAINADNTIGITNCTIFLGSGTAQDMTAVGNACTASYTAEDFSISDNGIYDMIITATDANADTTNTSTRTFEVILPAGGGIVLYNEVIEDDGAIEDGIIPSEKNIITRILDKIIEFFKKIFK